MHTQELFYSRDTCKPRYLCLLNILVNGQVVHQEKHAFFETLVRSDKWAVVVEGDSAAVGCLNTIFDNRYFACFRSEE